MSDGVLEYMREKGFSIDRKTYFELAFWGDWDYTLPLPAEMEAEIPEEVQFPNWGNLTQSELDLIFEGVDEAYLEKYL